MIENMMKLHKCETCAIRCRAMAKPDSVYARIHRWHMTWWPGWQIYKAALRARTA
jgi:Cdc6-like AAA superfamily ATPase